MKKFLIAALTILSLSGTAKAVQQVWLASTTATADTTQRLCPAQGLVTPNMGHGVFHGVCIDVPIVALSGTVQVFNSSGTSANSIATILTNTAPPGCLYFDVPISSGLSYSTVSTATVTMLYLCE